MRTTFIILTMIGLSLSAFGQVPSGMKYQGLLKDASNLAVSNKDIEVEISLQGGATAYAETHDIRTSPDGIFSLVIGSGTPINGSYASLSWEEGNVTMDVSVDGEMFEESVAFTAVPYALYSVSGLPGPQGGIGPAGEQGPIGPAGPQGDIGPQGPAGTGVKIIGSVATVGDLPNPYNGDPGDMYIVTSTGDGHVWNGTSFDNVGEIRGPEGPQGQQGAQGIQGPQGETGQQGSQGIQGPQGDPGPQGDVGPEGPQGNPGAGVNIVGTIPTSADVPSSYSGEVGDMLLTEDMGIGFVWNGTTFNNVGAIRGPQGNTGSQGPQGDQGPAGAQGDEGPQGPMGLPGMQGPPGTNGVDGANGMDGTNGTDGMDGTDGAPGMNGTDGMDGEDGINCWDRNGNGIDDPGEDINGDGMYSAEDCIGPQGPPGTGGGSSIWTEVDPFAVYEGGIELNDPFSGDQAHLDGFNLHFHKPDGSNGAMLYGQDGIFGDGGFGGVAIELSRDAGGLSLSTFNESSTSYGVTGINASAVFSGGYYISLASNTHQLGLSGNTVVAGRPGFASNSFPFVVRQSEVFGLGIENPDNRNWELTVDVFGDDPNLSLYADNVFKGSFNGDTGVYTNTSDRRLKENINPINKVLKEIKDVEVVSYNFKNSSRQTMGIIAQDIQNIFPHLVYEHHDKRNEGLLTVDYAGFGVLAIKAIQEQQVLIDEQSKENETLKSDVEKLQNKNADLEERLEKLEKILENIIKE